MSKNLNDKSEQSPCRNVFSGLQDFKDRWDNPSLANSDCQEPNKVNRSGQINLTGKDDCTKARTYTRYETEFEGSLETGVKRLVLSLIEIFDCITYSSCQGHNVTDENKHFALRHVSILPRNFDEYEYYKKSLNKITQVIGPETKEKQIVVKIVEKTLFSGNLTLPCLDIIFQFTGNGLEQYFDNIDFATDLFLVVLTEYG